MPEPQTTGTQTGATDGGDDAIQLALTGTQGAAADGGDAGATESVEELRARLAKLEEEKQQWLPEKSHLEELKREKAANAAAATAVTPPNADAYAQQQYQQEQQDWANTLLLAQQGDPLARQTVRLAQIVAAQNRASAIEIAAMQVPEAYREDVKVALATGKFADHEAALRAVRGSKDLPAKDAEIDRLKRENESLKRAEEARKSGVVGAGRSVPDLSGARGAEPRNEVEFNAEIQRLERVGDPKARAELSRRYRRMELPFQKQ